MMCGLERVCGSRKRQRFGASSDVHVSIVIKRDAERAIVVVATKVRRSEKGRSRGVQLRDKSIHARRASDGPADHLALPVIPAVRWLDGRGRNSDRELRRIRSARDVDIPGGWVLGEGRNEIQAFSSHEGGEDELASR